MARSFSRSGPDQITYPHVSGLDGAEQVAVSMWIWPANGDWFDHILGQYDSDNSRGLQLLHPTGTLANLEARYRGADDATSYTRWVGVLTAGAWNHVVVQYDGTSGTPLRLYVDDVEASIDTEVLPSGSALPTITQGVALSGQYGAPWAAPFGGRLAGIGIWEGVVLSSGERTALAGGGLPAVVRSAGLVFDDPLLDGDAPENHVTSEAASVTGTTSVADPEGLGAAGAPVVVLVPRPHAFSTGVR